MAIAIDKSSLGSTAAAAGGSSTIAFTTSQAVASNGFIVVVVGWWSSTAILSSVSGGGLTWTIDAQAKNGSSNPHIGYVSAQAPSGLASGTTITATFSDATADGRGIGGFSFTGVATSSPRDVSTTGASNISGTAWTTPSMVTTTQAGSLVIGSDYDENGNATSTPTSPSVETLDIRTAGIFGLTSAYRIETAAGSYTVAGTWSATAAHNSLGIAYRPAGGAAFDAARATTVLTSSDPWTVNLPANIAAGDLLIVVGRTGGTPTFNLPSGWAWLIQNYTGDAADDQNSVIYRWASGSEGATLSWDLSAAAKGAALAWRIAGAHQTQAPEQSGPNTGTSANTNPPLTTPTGGSKDYLWLTLCAYDGITVATVAPTGYFNLITAVSTGSTAATNASLGGATRQATAASEDPGAFTHAAPNAGRTGITIAIHPAGAAPQTVSGGVATENDSTGTGHQVAQAKLVAGGRALENDTVPTGVVIQPIIRTALPAKEQDTVLVARVTGSKARVFPSTDLIRVAPDALATDVANWRAVSVVALICPTAPNASVLAMEGAGGSSQTLYIQMFGTAIGLLYNGDTRFASSVVLNAWQIVAVTIPSGVGSMPRFHRKVLTPDTAWAHANSVGGALSTGMATVITDVYLGRQTSGAAAEIGAMGVFLDTNFSDGQVESLDDNLATSDWEALSPDALWQLNQTVVTDPVTDLIGNADETTRTGTTVTDFGPPWVYTTAGAPQTISGGVATEQDSVAAGKAAQVYPATGGTVETDWALSGKVQQRYTAAPSQEQDAVQVGKVLQRYTAAPAPEQDTVPAGIAIVPQVVAGGRALESDTVPSGKVLQRYTAASASEQDTVPAAKVQQIYTAALTTEQDTALAAKVLQRYTAAPAPEQDTAPVAKVQQRYTAAPASESDSVLTGTVQVGSAQTIAAGRALEVDAVPASKVLQRYLAPVVIEQDTVPAGSAGVAQAVAGGRALESDVVSVGKVLQRYLAGFTVETDAGPVGKVLQRYISAPSHEWDSAVAGHIFIGEIIPPPVTHPILGGTFDQTLTGGVVSLDGVVMSGVVHERKRGGVVRALLNRGYVAPEHQTGGRVHEPSRSAAPAKPRGGQVREKQRGGTYDQSKTGGEVL